MRFSRFRLLWSITSRNLKSDWINFLGMFVYYIHGINIHHHVYYNKKYNYYYCITSDGNSSRPLIIEGKRVFMPIGINATDTCIICDTKAHWEKK